MSVDVIRLVKGDERPLIILTLTDDVTNTPVDLSASTTSVSIKFRAAGTTDTPAVIPCGKLTTGADGKVIFGLLAVYWMYQPEPMKVRLSSTLMDRLKRFMTSWPSV
jgi:hypothetical protein